MRFVLVVALALAWFGTLALRPLYKADESRYAEIPREMVASGDWITPRLNGFKYFEKPPLQYWATAAFFELFGEKDWAARLWAALTGFAGVLLVLAAGNRLFRPPAGYFAAAVLAGSPLYVVLGQVSTLDMGVTFFLTAAVLALCAGRMLLFWAACAAAVLSKGLIGIVLPLGTVALYVLIRRDWGLIARIRPIAGPLLFLLIAAPWFVAVAAANDEFLRFFFIQEHFQRFMSEVHQRHGAIWYFVPILVVGMLPWLIPLGLAWARAFRRVEQGFDPQLFLGLWALVVFLFFSLSGSKLPSYILPMFPALALLIGRWLATQDAPRVLRIQSLLFAVVVAIPLAALAPHFARNYPGYGAWLVAAGIAAALCAIGAFVFPRRAIVLLAAGAFLATQLGIAGHATQAARYSTAGLIAGLQPPIPHSAPIYTVDGYDHSIPWYLRRTVTMVSYKDELTLAVEWEPQKFIRDLPTFAQRWQTERDAYAFIPLRELDRLQGQIPMQVLARDPRYVIVRKP